MNSLKNLGLTENEIEQIVDMYGISNIEDLSCNIEEVETIINYLKTIGIKVIKDLLIYDLDFFFRDLDDVKAIFEKNNQEELVNKINSDYQEIFNY